MTDEATFLECSAAKPSGHPLFFVGINADRLDTVHRGNTHDIVLFCDPSALCGDPVLRGILAAVSDDRGKDDGR